MHNRRVKELEIKDNEERKCVTVVRGGLGSGLGINFHPTRLSRVYTIRWPSIQVVSSGDHSIGSGGQVGRVIQQEITTTSLQQEITTTPQQQITTTTDQE